MSSKIPTIRQVAWISLIPQLTLMALIMLLWYQFDATNFIIYGALTYLLFSFLLSQLISGAHKRGMRKVKIEQFKKAIPDFEKSYNFFKKYDWVDRFRYLTILSSSAMSFKEMALVNIAFCYGQMGDPKMCRAYYERALQEFPESGMAQVGLRFLDGLQEEE